MNSVGIFEAETQLPQLLARVARGERIVITDDGKAVAVLAPPEAPDRGDSREAGRAMLEYRDQARRALGGSFRDLAHVDRDTEAQAWSATIDLARRCGLTVYDAPYLELAMRERVPLASLDAKLEAAARAVGVPPYRP